MTKVKLLVLIMIMGFLLPSTLQADGQVNAGTASKSRPELFGIEIIKSIPHDSNAFTQGLTFFNGDLYESTGLYHRSTLRKIDIHSGRVTKMVRLDRALFGEGIAILNDKIYQLTWKNKMGFVYDVRTFKQIGRFDYEGEGWGLTQDGQNLIMSDGSSTITFRNPNTYEAVRKIEVLDGNRLITGINELEYVQGEIWANIFMENNIVRIDARTGRVSGWIDIGSLYAQIPDGSKVDVLNGIAYDPLNNRIFVTGKLWPKIFEIRLIKK